MHLSKQLCYFNIFSYLNSAVVFYSVFHTSVCEPITVLSKYKMASTITDQNKQKRANTCRQEACAVSKNGHDTSGGNLETAISSRNMKTSSSKTVIYYVKGL